MGCWTCNEMLIFKDTSMHHWKYKPVKLMKQEIKNKLI